MGRTASSILMDTSPRSTLLIWQARETFELLVLEMGINNAGTIVGTFDTRADAGEFAYGFVEKKGQILCSVVVAVQCPIRSVLTTTVQSFGNYFQVNRGNLNGFVQDVKGNRTTISVLGAFETSVSGFNARGDIVGQYRDLSGYHSFLDHAGNINYEEGVPGAQQTIAMDINDWGVIVGSFLDINNRSHGFLDIAGHFITVDVPGSQSTNITGINNLGLFIGGFIDANGRSHAFVDPPSEVPEPAPLFLLASGLVGLALLRKDFTKYARAYCDLPQFSGHLEKGGSCVTPEVCTISKVRRSFTREFRVEAVNLVTEAEIPWRK